MPKNSYHVIPIKIIPIKENTVNSKFRLWAARIVGGVVLPAALAVGLGAASASAQPSASTHVTSTQRPDHAWYIYGIYYNYGQCYNQYYWFTHHHYDSYYRYYDSFYYRGHYYYHVWVLYNYPSYHGR